MRRALVCVATYNEILTLPVLVDRLEAAARQLPAARLDLLVVDDNSPDGTGRWCDAFRAREIPLHVLHRTGKLGLGSAMVAAIRWGVERDYDYLLTMDADLSHDPRSLPELLAALATADVAIGSRYVVGGEIRNWPWRRRWLSRVANRTARVALGLSPLDCSSGYRAYRREALQQLNLAALRSRGYLFYEEVLMHLQRAGSRIVEIPIVFVDRAEGRSKINLTEISQAARTLAELTWRRMAGHAPQPMIHHEGHEEHEGHQSTERV